jgi:hypothetical protein
VKAVLDTNVLVSAMIGPQGAPAAILKAWREREFQLVTSSLLVAEAGNVLRRRRIQKFTGLSLEDVEELLDDLLATAVVVEPSGVLDVIASDPDDNRVLEAALGGEADYVVSGDRDLLDLKRYEHVEIVTPMRFLAVLSASRQ